MKRDEQACTAVPFHDGLAEHLTQIARIIHTELRKVLADEDLSAVESGVIMCLSTTKVFIRRYSRAHCAAHGCFALVDE